MVMDDRCLTINQIADAVAISRERVENILLKELGMLKVSAWWVPHFLTPDQKNTRLVMSQANLAVFKAVPDSFLECFLTQDECWVHHFEAETKQQSMQWKLFSPSKDGQGVVVCRKGNGLRLLGCKGYCIH